MLMLAQPKEICQTASKYTEGNMTYLIYGAISVKEQMSIKQPW